MKKVAINLQPQAAVHWPYLFSAPFIAGASFLRMFPFTGSRMDEVRRFNEMEEKDFDRQGVTRDGEVDRIFTDPR